MTMNQTGHAPPHADFEVDYRFRPPGEEHARSTGPPFQGYRCDWAYEGDDIVETGIYMIWPEFLAEDGVPLPKGARVPPAGKARMWILDDQLRRKVHSGRIVAGVRGHFMEGGRRVADAVVTRILGLHLPRPSRVPAEFPPHP